MTLPFCRLAPTAGSLEVRQGFVSYRRISTYSIVIISQISAFVNSLKGFFPKKGTYRSGTFLSILKTSFHLPPVFRHVDVMWNFPERSEFSGFSAVVVMT
jgi:hypothetical protein